MRLIDADVLKEELKPCEEGACELTCKDCRFRVVTAEDIDNATTIEPDKIQAIMSDFLVYTQRPHGEWVDNKNILYLANCSNCGYQMDTHEEHGYFNYCPYCGADMGGKEE